MSDLSRTQLAAAIRLANDRVEPITLPEIHRRPLPDIDGVVVDLDVDRLSQSDSESEPIELGARRRVLAAVAGVLVIVGALVVLNRLGADQQVTTVDRATTTTVSDDDGQDSSVVEDAAVVERFADAFVSFDSEAVESLLGADSVDVQFTVTPDRKSIGEELAAWTAVGGRAQLVDCAETPTAGTFECVFLVDDKLSRAQGIASLSLPMFVIVEDGRIKSARIQVATYRSWVQQVWSPFGDWVAVERRDQVPIVFPDGLPGLADVGNPEAYVLYERMVDDFVKEVGRPSLTEDQP